MHESKTVALKKIEQRVLIVERQLKGQKSLVIK